MKYQIMAFAAVISGNSLAAQTAPPWQPYQPTIDIKKSPNCGTKLPSKAARIAHNRKLAELYFVNFQESKARGRNVGWGVHRCMAEGNTVLLGATEPLGTPTVRSLTTPSSTASPTGDWSGEQRGYYDIFEDFAPVPNTLVVIPFEEGAFFRMMYAGKAKDDGKQYTIWESNLILVNDEGRITHFEMWNDSIGMDDMTRKIFGKGMSELSLTGYRNLTEAFPAKPETK